MKHVTAEHLQKINEINGTLSNRAEYFEKIAEITGAYVGAIRWNAYRVKGVVLAEHLVMEIECKTIKGKLMIKYMNVRAFAHFEDSQAWKLEGTKLVGC